MDFNPKKRPKEISDEIAERLYEIAQKKHKALTGADRCDLILASGFVLGQATLIRSAKKGEK